jgi:hypothetical protein
MDPRRTAPREVAARKEKAKQRLTERQKWNAWMKQELHTLPGSKSRKAYAKATFDDMVARGIITDWRWPRGERSFIIPMTMPHLSEDQRACVLVEFFRWDEQQPVE